MVLYCHGLYRYGQGLLPTRHAAHARAMQRILRHRRHRRHPLRLHQHSRSRRHYLEKTATAVLARRGLARPAVTAAVQSHPTVQQAVMADIVMASIVMACMVMAYMVMAYVVMASINMASIPIADVVAVCSHRNCPPCRI